MGRKVASKLKRRATSQPVAATARSAGSAGPHRARSVWVPRPLAITLAGAALFRIAYAAQFDARSVFAGTPILDAAVYVDWARTIAAGQWLPVAPFYFAPGYAYALAILFKLVSASLTTVTVLQAALGLLNIVLIHRLAALAYDRRVATGAGVLAALYAAFPFLEVKLLSATLGLTLLLVLMVLLASAAARPGRWLAAGLVAGVGTLVRPETLLMVPLGVFWQWRWGATVAAEARADGAGPAGARPGRLLRAACLFVGGWAVAVAPLAWHNVHAGGGTSLISSQAGLTFYQGNNPRARGLYVSLEADGFSGEPEKQPQEDEALAGKALGRPVTRGEASSYWLGRGLAFIRQDPARFAWLEGMKLLRYASSFEYSTEYVLSVERDDVWLLWLAFVPFGLLLALAVPSIVRGLGRSDGAGDEPERRHATRWLLLLAVLANLATCLVFYVSSRYRLGSVPSLIVFAAATIVTLLDAHRRGRRRTVVVTAAVVAALFTVSVLSKGRGAALEEASAHFNAGTVWVKRGDQTRAADEFERATALDPSRFQNWFNLGSSLAELGRYARAAAAYGKAARLQPNLFDAHAQQGLMLMEVGDWQGARAALEQAEALRRNVFDLQIALGRVLARLGEREEALRHIDRALAMWPTSTVAREERDRLLRTPAGGPDSNLP